MLKQTILVIIISQSLFYSINCDQDQSKYNDRPNSRPVASGPHISTDECNENIYRRCNVPQYTKEEVENVRLFLNYSFMELADVKPDKPLCSKLNVRKDWKCLSQKEKHKVVNVWKTMYQKNLIQKLTDLHVKTWSAWHKTTQFLASHRWLAYKFEKYMQEIDPTVTLPYLDAYLYGTHPERASIWDTLGHSGNYSNGYCVQDGIYKDFELVPCLKRHWTDRGTIYPWFTPDIMTSFIQITTDYSQLGGNTVAIHFGPHLNVGGDVGQMSIRTAPYDLYFHLTHNAFVSSVTLFWQLLNPSNLTPLIYSADYYFDPGTGNIRQADFFTDLLEGVPGVTIKETFWIGFGDYCFIPDKLIKPINAVWNSIKTNTTPPNPYIPESIKRLPNYFKAKYFPLFMNKTISPFASLFEDVGQCNRQCLPMVKPTFMQETWAGRRQYEAFAYDNGLDFSGSVTLYEQVFYQMFNDLNSAGYCSPYVTI